MIWIILISFLVFLLLWALIVPVIAYIDTNRNRYFLDLPGIFRAVIVPVEGLFYIRMWIFFVPFTFDPFHGKTGKNLKDKKESVPVRKRKRGKRSIGGILGRGSTAVSLLRAFRIRKLELDIDTGDFILNAWLIPVFSTVNSENIRMRANFTGQASMLLDLRVKLGDLFWILIVNKIKSFY